MCSTIKTRRQNAMSKQEFLDVISEATGKILALQERLKAGGMTAAEEAEVLAELKKLSQTADPDQPNP